MAYDATIFSYNALHNFIKNVGDDNLLKIFSVIETKNFEIIMQYLDSFSALINVFEGDKSLKIQVDEASTKLKESLLVAVKGLHPEHVFKIPEERIDSCANFLKHFLNSKGNIYSTNYDLLLYWVLMRSNIADHIDGCGRGPETSG
jgi:hypothetical protein